MAVLASRREKRQVREIAQAAREALFGLNLERVVERGSIHLVNRKVAGELGIGRQRLFEGGSASELSTYSG